VRHPSLTTRHRAIETRGTGMDLKSGYPFWAIKNGLMYAFPQLRQDRHCDVAVIGGGISGALIANELAEHGHDVVVVEQRDIGWGSSAASTALLQYEIDTHMTELAARFGEADAVLAYRACADAIGLLQALAGEVRDVDFACMRSLYYASRRRDVEVLRAELALRRKHGFDVSWVGAAGLHADYSIDAPGAILSQLAARIDPYRMAWRLFERLEKRGSGVFDRTCIERITAGTRGVTLHTGDGVRLRAGHVVFAAGYASQHWLEQRVASNRSSYAFITDPLDPARLRGLADTMAWESARPYLYLRSTGDGRLLVGGEDDAIDIPSRRDARVDSKARQLVRKVARAIPGLALEPAFAWAGTFAETDDGLPFFGPHPQYGPRVQFAMAYGGNGITYSMLGAGLLCALIERRRHPLAKLFSFERQGR
jgi:glycine/D-amino acid oxidase-like deaminating enzyme